MRSVPWRIGSRLWDSDVNEAYVEARHVYQRPRHVSEVRKTFFNFTLSFSRHTVQVVCGISLEISQVIGHSLQ